MMENENIGRRKDENADEKKRKEYKVVTWVREKERNREQYIRIENKKKKI